MEFLFRHFWLSKWSLFHSRRDPLKFDGLAFLNTKLLIRCPCSDENNASGFTEAFWAHSGEIFEIIVCSAFHGIVDMHLPLDVGRLWSFGIRHTCRPNLSEFLHFFGDRSSVIFSNCFVCIIKLIWISRTSFDPWDIRQFFGLITCGRYDARVSATLQVSTPEWSLMTQQVNRGSLEMCGMYWVFSLCGRIGRWRRGLMEEGAWENNHGWDMRHTRWQNSFQTRQFSAICVVEAAYLKMSGFYTILIFGHFWAPLFSLCFYTIMNFSHFWATPRPWPSTMSRTMEVRAQKESQEELPGTKNKRKQRKQHRVENHDEQK